MITNYEITYVDDDSHNLEIFKKTFNKYFNIKTFQDPIKAKEYILSSQKDGLILTNKLMSKVSGFEFAKSVKEKKPNSIFIMLTNHPENELDFIQNCFKNNLFFDFLKKPLNLERINKNIHLFFRALSSAHALKTKNSKIESRLESIVSDQQINSIINLIQPDSKNFFFLDNSIMIEGLKENIYINKSGHSWILSHHKKIEKCSDFTQLKEKLSSRVSL